MSIAPPDQITRRVLCVDDDANILDAFKRHLRKLDLTTAEGPQAGLIALREQGPFAVVVSDYKMPGMSGTEFLHQVHQESPETILVMLTGIADISVVIAALHDAHIFRFLTKPCPPQILSHTLSDCLEQYRIAVSERLLTQELNKANLELQSLNDELERRVESRTASIRRLHQFVSDLNGLASLADVAEVIVTTTADILRSRKVCLMMADQDGQHLRTVASTGLPDELVSRLRVPIGAPMAGMVFAESHTVVANEPCELPPHENRHDDELFSSFPLACAALVTSEVPVGVLTATDRLEGAPYDYEAIVDLKSIAEAAAIALMNQIRLAERNEARDATIMALARLAENRDPETGAHLERVQTYCRVLSESLAMTPEYRDKVNSEFIDHIVRSSPLHDIGKVGIPDHILLKKGRLTPEEFEQMKLHASIGGNTIRSLVDQLQTPSFLHMGMQIAYAHHEKYDGSGYPDGLRGQDIPLAARILALADVYDALTSKRCYKEAMPHEKAASIIRSDSGTHFDPQIVAAFDRQEAEFRRLSRELADGSTPEAPVELAAIA